MPTLVLTTGGNISSCNFKTLAWEINKEWIPKELGWWDKVEMWQQLLIYLVLPMAERSLTSGGTSHVLKAEEKTLKHRHAKKLRWLLNPKTTENFYKSWDHWQLECWSLTGKEDVEISFLCSTFREDRVFLFSLSLWWKRSINEEKVKVNHPSSASLANRQ